MILKYLSSLCSIGPATNTPEKPKKLGNISIGSEPEISTPSRPATLKVSNLDSSVTVNDIKDLFSEFGQLRYTVLKSDTSGLASANVTFEQKNDAISALKKFKGVPLDGTPMKLTLLTSRVSPVGSNFVKKVLKQGPDFGKMKKSNVGPMAKKKGRKGKKGGRGTNDGDKLWNPTNKNGTKKGKKRAKKTSKKRKTTVEV